MAGPSGRPASCLEATPQAREYMYFSMFGMSVHDHTPGGLGRVLQLFEEQILAFSVRPDNPL